MMRRLWNKYWNIDDTFLNNARFTPRNKSISKTIAVALALVPAVLHGYHNSDQEKTRIDEYIQQTKPNAHDYLLRTSHHVVVDQQQSDQQEQQQQQNIAKQSEQNTKTLLFKNVDTTNVSWFLASSILSSYFAYRAIKASVFGRVANVKPGSSKLTTLVKKGTNFSKRGLKGAGWSFMFAMAYINSVERVEDWLRHDRLVHKLELIQSPNGTTHLSMINQSKFGIKRTIAVLPWNSEVQEELRLYYDIANKRELYDTGVPIEYYNRFLLFGATGYLLPKTGIIHDIPKFTELFFRFSEDLAQVQVSSKQKSNDDLIKIANLSALSKSTRWHIVLDKQYHYLLANHEGKWFLTNMFCNQHRKPLIFSPIQQLIENLEHTYETSTILKKDNGSSEPEEQEITIPIRIENDSIYAELSGLVKQEEVATLHNVFSSYKAAAFTFTDIQQEQ